MLSPSVSVLAGTEPNIQSGPLEPSSESGITYLYSPTAAYVCLCKLSQSWAVSLRTKRSIQSGMALARSKFLNSSPALTFEPFVDAAKVAAFLSLKKREVLHLTRLGRLPAHPVDPNAARKCWRYRLSEVDKAIGSNSVDMSKTWRDDLDALGSPKKARKRRL